MASKNTKCYPTQAKKFAFIAKKKSNSFPRALCEEASIPNANLMHALSYPSLSFTYTSVKDLMPCVKSNRRSPLSKGRLSTVQSAEEIAISNFLVQKAAWAYLQPMPKTSTAAAAAPPSRYNYFFWGHLRSKLKSPMNACLKFFNSNVVGKVTHALDMILRAICAV